MDDQESSSRKNKGQQEHIGSVVQNFSIYMQNFSPVVLFIHAVATTDLSPVLSLPPFLATSAVLTSMPALASLNTTLSNLLLYSFPIACRTTPLVSQLILKTRRQNSHKLNATLATV